MEFHSEKEITINPPSRKKFSIKEFEESYQIEIDEIQKKNEKLE